MQQCPTLHGGKAPKPGLSYLNYWAQHGFKRMSLGFAKLPPLEQLTYLTFFLLMLLLLLYYESI